jgi:hypothetical protein
MDTTLVGVTLLSMAMAASLSVVVWRMLRDERQRSDARVIALSRMAGAHQKSTDARVLQAFPRDTRGGAQRDLSQELPLHDDAPVVMASDLFTAPKHESPWGHRVAVMSGLGLVVASVILFALTAADRKAPARSAQAPAAQGAAPAAAATGGLELLSLRDSRQAESLTITGLVHNPRDGVALTRVTVTAYTFDDKGSFLASGRALIDVTALAPGDESPFVVSVPVSDAVARYRIGFRDEAGRVIAHVDKRRQASVAANW